MDLVYTDDEIIELFDERSYDKLLSYLNSVMNESEVHFLYINFVDGKSKQTRIMSALIILNKIDILDILFLKYVNQFDPFLMEIIIKHNSIEIFKIILQVNPSLKPNKYIRSIIYHNRLEILKIIMEYDIDNSFTKQIVQESISHSNITILEYLFDIGLGSCIQTEFDTVIDQTLDYRDPQLNLMGMISLLIKNDIDIWMHINDICHQADLHRDDDLLEFCLQNGADINYKNGIMFRNSFGSI